MFRKLVTSFVCLSLCLLYAQDKLPIDLMTEIEQVEEFPIEVDKLDEFIQSYYTLLDSEEYLKGFSFIKTDSNTINNWEKRLSRFLLKLMELRSGLRDQVTIYQIGDSHIKSGFLATTVRSSLKEYFEAGDSGQHGTLNYQFTGVNGGSFQNLLKNTLIFNRCKELSPDLIIISLGTNDAQGTYNAKRFRGEIAAFMDHLSVIQDEAVILFTLPPDSNKRGKHNADLEKVGSEIEAWAEEHDYAWWDLSAVMGGKKSISKWRSEGLASKDMIHFSPQGYMLQGKLLYQALMRAYTSYAGADE